MKSLRASHSVSTSDIEQATATRIFAAIHAFAETRLLMLSESAKSDHHSAMEALNRLERLARADELRQFADRVSVLGFEKYGQPLVLLGPSEPFDPSAAPEGDVP